MSKNLTSDFLIIGSGIAGLTIAKELAQKGSVILISKTKLAESNSSYAQGGIAAVLHAKDSFEKHIQDTLIAGHHHNDKAAVETLVKGAPEAIKDLQEIGVKFEQEQGLEGGHSKNRISHVADQTGKAIIEKLIETIKKTDIQIIENCFAQELITKNAQCYGAQTSQGNIFAGQTILATGGLGQIFQKTTNPKIATGDGLAMAIRAGAKISDLEFIQFHPTALEHDQSPLFLISEAVRGEGAILQNENGKQFMEKIHPLQSLAPRDIVTAEIRKQQQKGHKTFLNITQHSKTFLQKRFPHIYQKLQSINIKMESDLIPITPAAHYSCGGITVNQQGQTNIQNLLAAGEVACTGVHGKNRLASNSLLEALVFGKLLAKKLQKAPIKTIETNKSQATEKQNISLLQALPELSHHL